jgi:putative ABC transport system permease protein
MADIGRQTKIFQQVGCYRWSGFNITESNRPESITGIKTSLDLLPMFGIQPFMGRFFTPEEMHPGHEQVAIIGHRLWQERYGPDLGILGRTIDLDEKRYTIGGVMPARFRFTWDQEMDVFMLLALTPDELSEAARATSRDLQAQGRLQPGVSDRLNARQVFRPPIFRGVVEHSSLFVLDHTDSVQHYLKAIRSSGTGIGHSVEDCRVVVYVSA